MNISDTNLFNTLKSFLTKHEGYRNKAYKDIAGKWTIGIGHLILPHEKEMIKNPISDARVLELFRNDVTIALKAVSDLVKVPITLNQATSLVSFTYNFGVNALSSSTLLRKLNSGAPLDEVAKEFDRWVFATDPKSGIKVKSIGLINRRRDEKLNFLA